MNIELTDFLFILLIFQLLLLSIFLFTQQKGNLLSNRLLGTFFLVIGLNLMDVFILKTGIYFDYPSWAGWGNWLPLVFGPLLYFYVQSIVYRDFSISLKRTIHFLPALIFFLVTEAYYLSLPYDGKEKLLTDLQHHHIAAGFAWVSGIILLQFLLYMMASLRLVAQYKRATAQLFSSPKNTDISWLYTTLVFFTAVMIVAMLNSALAQTPMAKYYLFGFNLVMLAVLIFVVKVLLKAFQQSHFFSFQKEEALNVLSTNTAELNPVERHEREKIVQAAISYMKTNKPYLKPELRLDELAAMLSLKPRALSQAINDIQQQNFFDFINRYRINEAVRLLTNPADKKLTVLEVLYEVGFNSKSSFNALFKKYTGLTPTEFRKNST